MINRQNFIWVKSVFHFGVITALMIHAAAAWPAALVVNSAADTGAGTLRDAILTANTNGESDTITFSLPLYSTTLGSSLPDIVEPNTIIDGSGSTAIINGAGFSAFTLSAVTSCTIRNLTIAGANYGVLVDGGSGHGIENIKVQSSTWPIYLEGSSSTVVRGSTIENNTNGIALRGATFSTIGGTTLSATNFIRGQSSTAGILLQDIGTNSNVITGNVIGLNAAGTAPQANSIGIYIQRGAFNRIGGTAPGERNIISGNTFAGIWLRRIQAAYNRVEGNLIGVSDDGTTPVPNFFAGVQISDEARNNFIGGATAAHANIIKGNLNGVVVTGTNSTQNRILRNSIYENSNRGIILTSNGNLLLPAPVLESAAPIRGTVTVDGTVQFFVDDADQGEIFVAESGTGGGFINTASDLSAYEGRNLTATLTSPVGNTSAFSVPILIDVTPPVGGLDVADPIVVDNNAELLITPPPTDNFTATNDIEMRFSNDGITWSAWEPYAATKPWDLNFGIVSPVGGPRIVSAQYRDELLNVSITYEANIEIDITPPTGGVSLGSTVYIDPAVILDVVPTPVDNNSPLSAIEMRFSNNAVDWSPWEPYAATKAWDLNQDLLDTSDGIRIVRAQFRDEPQNISITYTASAELDTTGPQVTGFILSDPNPTSANLVSFQLSFDEPLLNFATGIAPITDDINLLVNGALTGSGIESIVNNGGANYTINVATGSGDGLISLVLVDTGGITDEHGNPFIGGQTVGPYIVDRLTVTQDPIGGSPTQYDSYGFTISTSGGIGQLHYEWRQNGVPVLNADDAPVYFIPELALSDSGEWSCAVTDDYITVESAVAQLDVQIAIPAASGLGLAALASALALASARLIRRRK